MVSPAETLCRTVGAVSLSCGQVCSSVACRGRIAQHIAARKDCVHLANGREEFAASALGVDNHKKSSRLQPVVAAVSHKRLLRDSLVKDVVDQQHARAPRRGHTFQQASQAIGLPFLAQIEPVERLDAHGSIHREHASDNGNGCGLNASDPLGVIPARAAPQKYAAARQRLVQQKRGAQIPDKRIAARFHRSPSAPPDVCEHRIRALSSSPVHENLRGSETSHRIAEQTPSSGSRARRRANPGALAASAQHTRRHPHRTSHHSGYLTLFAEN